MERTQDDVRIDRGRCPYCHDDLQADERKHGCPVCMAWHHAACWDEAGRTCSACGEAEPPALGRVCWVADCERSAEWRFCAGHLKRRTGLVLVGGGVGLLLYLAAGLVISFAMGHTPNWAELIAAVVIFILLSAVSIGGGLRLRSRGAELLAASEASPDESPTTEKTG